MLSRGLPPPPIITASPTARLFFALFITFIWTAAQIELVHAQLGNFTIYGRVSASDGRPAARVTVKLEGLTGLNRQTQSDDQGAYEFRSVPGGRYHLSVINPADSTQVMEAVEADTTRSSSNRLLVHLYLRNAPTVVSKGNKPGVLTVVEASQNIPKTARKAFEQGVKYKTENKDEQALASFSRALEMYPEYFQAMSERGDLHIQRGQVEEATVDFEHALKLDEQYAPALRGIGYCKLEQQKFGEAARYLVRALDINADDSRSHLFLGIALIGLKETELAKQAFQQALKLDAAGAISARIYLADVYTRENKFNEAAAELQIYLNAKPNAPNAARLKALEAEMRARAKSATYKN